jgi:hypothetical protein
MLQSATLFIVHIIKFTHPNKLLRFAMARHVQRESCGVACDNGVIAPIHQLMFLP